MEFTFAVKEMSVFSNDTSNCLHLMQDNKLLGADYRTKALLLSIIGSLGEKEKEEEGEKTKKNISDSFSNQAKY